MATTVNGKPRLLTSQSAIAATALAVEKDTLSEVRKLDSIVTAQNELIAGLIVATQEITRR